MKMGTVFDNLETTFVTFRKSVLQNPRYIIFLAVSIWEAIYGFFMRLKIRIKLSLIVGISIAVAVAIISMITVRRQESQLRGQTEILGKTIVQNLVDIAKENILLKSSFVIQEHVSNLMKRKIPGLEVLLVIDRNGIIVAHSTIDSVHRSIPASTWRDIMGSDSLRMLETPSHLYYVDPIYVVKKGQQFSQKILIGGALIGFSKDVVLSPIEEMKHTLFITSAIVSTIVIIVVFFTAKKIVKIIVALSEAARLVGLGHFQVKVITPSKDEVGTLATEFNQMVRQIREKTEMEKFVSRLTVQMLADGSEAALGGTRSVITVMFTDLRNFTSVSETLWPEEAIQTLNQYLDIETQMIQQHHGVVDKFMGDGIMSIFAGREMTINAVTAAVALEQAISQLNKCRVEKGEKILEVGVGIAVGSAVLGSIGSRDRMDYTAIGNTVNLAARLCAAAGPSEILITEDVVNHLGGRHPIGPESIKLSVKGRKGPISVYHVPFSFA